MIFPKSFQLLVLSALIIGGCQNSSSDQAAKSDPNTSAEAAPETSNTKLAVSRDTVVTTAASTTPAAAGKELTPLDSLRLIGPKITGSILPDKRILAYYGNPHSKRMGVLGEYPKDEMLRRLDRETKNWEKADPSKPVQQALHLVAITAQGAPGKDGKYRLRMTDYTIRKVIKWAAEHNAICFLDVQVGLSTLQQELPYLEKYLTLPYVHLGIDPEFSMKTGARPGTKIGTYDAADINYAVNFLSRIKQEHNLPTKILVVHRFTQRMVTNYKNIKLNPNVQIVMHMDGWGEPVLKRDSYRDYIKKEMVQYTGFKIFYHNDVKKPPHHLMTAAEVLTEDPKPIYIQYQ
ncbi:hypothetical protein [Nibrella saemangeumensis]